MVRLGLDAYSLRSQGWTPFQFLDFCAAWGVRVAHFSEPRLIGGLANEHLRGVRARADALGMDIELGMLSICPTSSIFDASRGSAEEQIAAMVEAAEIVRSPLIRCVVGRLDDRRSAGGIEARIADALQVLKRMRTRVMDAGLKVAVENHNGDMQARELKTLVEEAGTDFVGVCLDSGNPVRAIEDPNLTVDTLAPYVLTSHVRDSAVWPVDDGAAVTWTRMGEGSIGMARYLETFITRCPGRALSLEVIVPPEPRIMAYHHREFWDAYRDMPAWEFERFTALVDRGAPVDPPPDEDASTERSHVEACLSWTKTFLAERK